MSPRTSRSNLGRVAAYGSGIGVLLLIAVVYFLRHKILTAAQLWIVSASISGLPLHEGDLIFQTSRSAQSLAVQHATGSPYSHMGMVVIRDKQTYVLEASATVRYTPVARWVMRGVGHHFVVKRLLDSSQVLTPTAVDQIERLAATFVGRPYDLTFEWSDDRIYCSELVWKIYDRALGIQIGELQRVRDFSLSDPIVADVMRQRYSTAAPLDEPVISPVAMFDSRLLATVSSQ